MDALVTGKRDELHAGIISSGTLTVSEAGIPSNADKGNKVSVAVAAHIAETLKVSTRDERAAGQTLGGNFEGAIATFLNDTFLALGMLRPGRWDIRNVGNLRRSALSEYEPYRHLADLDEAVTRDPTLLSVLGNAYAISPDIIVSRMPEPDQFINASQDVVDDRSATHAVIRETTSGAPILHAVVSCKWTLRSDRAQNARSEALNLIRNRKGRNPHIAVVTFEPLPSRLASLALGTGDIDCVYHLALPELVAAVGEHGGSEAQDLLHNMVAGQRLRDVSDLPLDLAV